MPLREYECQACNRRIEKIKSFSAPPETVCPHCGGELRETMSAPAIQFKGSGWYVSDYAKSGVAKQPADGAKDSGDSGKKESSGVDVSASAEKPATSESTKKAESAPVAPATSQTKSE